MSSHLSHQIKTVRVQNAVAAGTTDQQSSGVDTTGADGVRFVVGFGTLTAGQVTSAKLQCSDDDGDADDYTDLANVETAALADADSNKLLILDVVRPPKKYVRLYEDRATQNAVIDFAVAELYNLRDVPTSTHSTVKELVTAVDPVEE